MRRNVLFIAAILLVAGSLPSAAQIRVDMNNMTCGNWLGYSPENREFVRYWMSGYYNAASNSNVLNYDRLQKNSAKVAAYCKATSPKVCRPRSRMSVCGTETDRVPTMQSESACDVRYWHLADISVRTVRCPLSGVERTSARQVRIESDVNSNSMQTRPLQQTWYCTSVTSGLPGS